MAEDQQPPPRTAHSVPSAPSAPSGGEERKLVRSRSHKVAGGVCGGLGRYFDVDPILFRVPLGVLSVIGGLGMVAYGFAWLLIPADGERENEGRRLLSGRVEGTALTAVLIALVGCGLFLASLGSNTSSFSLGVAVAVLGGAYWSMRRRSAAAQEEGGGPDAEGGAVGRPATAQVVADAPPETQAPPVPYAPSWWRDPLTKGDGGYGNGHDTGYLWGPDDAEPLPEEEHGWAGFARWRGGSPSGRRGHRSLGGPVFLAAFLAAVAGTAATWTGRPLGDSLATGLGSALAVFGLGLVLSAFVGRTGWGTIASVVVTAVLLAGAALLPKDISTDWDERHWAPTSAAQLQDRYRLGSGRGVLDLTKLRLREGQTVRVSARVGAGELKALVPLDVRVEARLEVAFGSYDLPGKEGSDSGGGVDRSQSRTLKPVHGGKARGTIEIELDVGVGDVSLVRSLPGGPEQVEQPEQPKQPEPPKQPAQPERPAQLGLAGQEKEAMAR